MRASRWDGGKMGGVRIGLPVDALGAAANTTHAGTHSSSGCHVRALFNQHNTKAPPSQHPRAPAARLPRL